MILGSGFDISFELMLYAALALIPIIYIRFAYEAGSKTIELTDGVLFYRCRSMVTDIAKKDFEGYEVTKLPPHTVVLHDKVYGKTEFSYYAFSASQRKQIFHMLDEFQIAK